MKYTVRFDIGEVLDMEIHGAKTLRVALEEKAWGRFVREVDPERDDYETEVETDEECVLVHFVG